MRLSRLGALIAAMPRHLEATVWLLAASFAVRQFRLERVLGLGTTRRAILPAVNLRKIERAIARTAAHLPWRPTCLPQAVAARWMLALRGVPSEVRLEISSMEQGSAAHASLVAGGVVLFAASDSRSARFHLGTGRA
jgi:hypothetical protein